MNRREQVEIIENIMDKITAKRNEVLTLKGYINHLLDFFDIDELETFYINIVEYWDELEWRKENTLSRA